jgi:hypothetical protein
MLNFAQATIRAIGAFSLANIYQKESSSRVIQLLVLSIGMLFGRDSLLNKSQMSKPNLMRFSATDLCSFPWGLQISGTLLAAFLEGARRIA